MAQNVLNNLTKADFTVVGDSGATSSLSVDNNNNTASSEARTFLRVGGTTASDVYDVFIVGSSRSYSVGSDNSDSQSFKITTAGDASADPSSASIIIKLTSAGEMTEPLQSCFMALNSASDTNVTGDGTAYTVICDSETFDQNSDYNNSTGVFTAPITARYHFSVAISVQNLSAGHTALFSQLVASNRNVWICNANPQGSKASDGVFNFQGMITVDMDAADTASIQVTVSGSTKTVTVTGQATNPITYFSGELVV